MSFVCHVPENPLSRQIHLRPAHFFEKTSSLSLPSTRLIGREKEAICFVRASRIEQSHRSEFKKPEPKSFALIVSIPSLPPKNDTLGHSHARIIYFAHNSHLNS